MPRYDENSHIRGQIVRTVLTALSLGILPISVKVDNQEREHRNLGKMLSRSGASSVGITKDPDGGRLWFRRRS